jgi:hypothetical protein
MICPIFGKKRKKPIGIIQFVNKKGGKTIKDLDEVKS